MNDPARQISYQTKSREVSKLIDMKVSLVVPHLATFLQSLPDFDSLWQRLFFN